MNGEDAQDVQSDPGRMGDGYGTDGDGSMGNHIWGENGEKPSGKQRVPEGDKLEACMRRRGR